MQWRSRLHVPACPGVPQVVPSEVFDAHSLQRRAPRFRIHLAHRFPAKAEHMRWVLPQLRAYHRARGRTQRNRNRLPRLRLIRVHPRGTSREVHLGPFQASDVGASAVACFRVRVAKRRDARTVRAWGPQRSRIDTRKDALRQRPWPLARYKLERRGNIEIGAKTLLESR